MTFGLTPNVWIVLFSSDGFCGYPLTEIPTYPPARGWSQDGVSGGTTVDFGLTETTCLSALAAAPGLPGGVHPAPAARAGPAAAMVIIRGQPRWGRPILLVIAVLPGH